MLDISKIRKVEPKIIALGSHRPIVQSILDFDYLCGKEQPSMRGIIAAGRKFERYFFGIREILIPVFAKIDLVPENLKNEVNFFLNVSSARRALSSTNQVIDMFPNFIGGSIFAEDVPERHALELYKKIKEKNVFIIGPASIGILIPGVLKLGAIYGIDVRQLADPQIYQTGNIAVFSASGGMTSELIHVVMESKKGISFALSFGGDRFPITTPKEAFLAAEKDLATKAIIYFGELGGIDEYEIAKILREKKVTKEVICYIAGEVATLFNTPAQFGHAKAMAKTKEETTKAKKEALRKAGANVANTFAEFVDLIKKTKTPATRIKNDNTIIVEKMIQRKPALITTSISENKDSKSYILNEELLPFTKSHSFAYIVISLFLGRKIKSKELEQFVDFVLRLLVDHGPYVSGAVNTIITARAGRDLVSSLAAGLLTIGPRFGGAINQAAANWLLGVRENKNPAVFVEEFAKRKQYISGIGHRKYRIDLPDPRVKAIEEFDQKLQKKEYITFAKQVEKITTAKKGNLILNVDGAIAAVLLDLLAEKEKMTIAQLQELVDREFFNAIFVLSRSVGFIGHYLDQKRLDEGLFRLPEDLVVNTKI